MPLVSVIMSVRNGLPYIGETIESVLAQSLTDFEFIIVDDGSTDGTSDAVRRFDDPRIALIEQVNTGVAVARNRATASSSGKYLAVIDADDRWLPDKLAHQVAFLEDNPDHVAVGGFTDVIDYDGTYIYTEKKPVENADIVRIQNLRNPWTHSAVMYTRRAYDAVGGYYEPVRQYIVDYMLMFQLSLHGKVHQLPEVVVQYRIVPTALSAKANSKEFDEIAHRAIQAGTMPAEDLQRICELKASEDRTPAFKQSMYHLYVGRSWLLHNYDRRRAIDHLKQCLHQNPQVRIARAYLWMAKSLPRVLVRLIYRSLSPNAKYSEVRSDGHAISDPHDRHRQRPPAASAVDRFSDIQQPATQSGAVDRQSGRAA